MDKKAEMAARILSLALKWHQQQLDAIAFSLGVQDCLEEYAENKKEN